MGVCTCLEKDGGKKGVLEVEGQLRLILVAVGESGSLFKLPDSQLPQSCLVGAGVLSPFLYSSPDLQWTGVKGSSVSPAHMGAGEDVPAALLL